ncbi:acyltransferase [Methanobrevibacter sp.]|uniref:acyltransferase n=1 Tax=Methanobrevibacter sp. TaxID=66852 RepID=UPI0025D5AE0F|nr:acyltransferase [Methanobrevibacter sp.]MBQ2961960.1 acyltransferase [Methanobrevibacter sp.]
MNQSKNPKQSKRIFYYDVLRALAIIGIVFCHASVSFVSRDISSPNLYISVFFDCFRDFSIPIFVMLSGALLIGKKDTLVKFFKKRLSRLFIPFLFWVLVYIIFTNIMSQGFNLDSAIKIFSGTAGTLGVHFWFVWMIIITYVGIFIINKIMQMESKISDFNKKFISILAILSVIYIGMSHYHLFNPYSPRLTYYISFLAYIIIGYFLAKCDFLEKRIDKKYLIAITALLFIGSYLWYIFCFVVPRSHMVHQFVRLSYFNLLILFMSANLFLLFKYISKTKSFSDMESNRLGNALTTISNYSYGIYLIHYLILYCIKINLIKIINFTQGSSLIWIPVLVILTTAISLIILIILDKIPYLDKVTGKK